MRVPYECGAGGDPGGGQRFHRDQSFVGCGVSVVGSAGAVNRKGLYKNIQLIVFKNTIFPLTFGPVETPFHRCIEPE